MILTRDVILEEIKKGNIKILPFDEKKSGAGIIWFIAGWYFKDFCAAEKPLSVTDDADFVDITKLIKLTQKGYTMSPGETVLGITAEKISLGSHIAGWLEGRSRFARLGLMVHISSPFMHPGINNRQFWKLPTWALRPNAFSKNKNLPVCVWILRRKATYDGKFKVQKSA